MKRVLAVFAMTLLVGAVTGVTAAAGADARIDTPSGALVIHFDEGECGIVLQPPFQGLELEGRGTAVFTAANPNIELITCAGPVPKSLGITQTLRYELTVPGGRRLRRVCRLAIALPRHGRIRLLDPLLPLTPAPSVARPSARLSRDEYVCA